ncbi:MAG: endolytic transglycosylase MltG, partial [Deltaproteobacteria bacterium]|nr:endolytic transglycosylase MltG [Deltaproteobacteria bacterium]
VGLSEAEILSAMIEEFFAHVEEMPAARELDPGELTKAVIVASMVEREAREKSETGRIAGVFKNRLERNMRLESCATVQYILGEPKARLRAADVRIPSPYNTYLLLSTIQPSATQRETPDTPGFAAGGWRQRWQSRGVHTPSPSVVRYWMTYRLWACAERRRNTAFPRAA